MRIITLLLIFTLIPSCVSLYTGNYKLADFSVKNQPTNLGGKYKNGKMDSELRKKKSIRMVVF